MASLREQARKLFDVAQEAIGWIAIWKEGRGWKAWDFYPDYTERTNSFEIEPEDRERMEEIVSSDGNALLVNGYYMNIGSLEEMTIESLTNGLRWQYEINGGNLREILEENK